MTVETSWLDEPASPDDILCDLDDVRGAGVGGDARAFTIHFVGFALSSRLKAQGSRLKAQNDCPT
jgi:hypothetical protein